MRTYNANYWEVYYPDCPRSKSRRVKRSKPADKKLKIAEHNRQIKELAGSWCKDSMALLYKRGIRIQ